MADGDPAELAYFDNNATTRPAPEVLDAMGPFLNDRYGNPSSAHTLGREANKVLSDARQAVAGLIGAEDEDEIRFTSGGTEADNWAIRGALEADTGGRHIVTTRVEHEAVRKLCERLERHGFTVTWLDVDEAGALDLDQLKGSLTRDTAVVSVMLANNETGILFPVNEIAAVVKENSDALFHVDGVNAAGKVPIDLKSSQIDLFSISAHKFHGPKGIGALYVRRGVQIEPLLIGGGQEGGTRAGTEATHQIAGIGAAAKFSYDLGRMQEIRALRDRLEDEILERIPNSRLNGTARRDLRLPNTSSVSFEGANGEMIMARLDELGFAVSTGSACNSPEHKASAVLEAMSVPYSYAMGSIRFSLGRFNTADEVERLVEVLPRVVDEVRKMAGWSTSGLTSAAS
jgi:cysteine desulfurase